MHVTVLKRGQEAPIERCTTCCNNLKYHCPFCTSEVYRPNELYHVKNHVFNHLSLAVKHEDFVIVKCNLRCRNQAHFHCCHCTTTVIRKDQIIKHLTACGSQSPTPSPRPCTESTFHTKPASITEPTPVIESESVSVTDPAVLTEPVSVNKLGSITNSASLSEHVPAQNNVHSGITVDKKNLDKHIRRKPSLKMHVTVLKSGQEAPIERCTTCCNNLKYHCPFCTSEVYRPNELYHVKNHVCNHLSLAVKHEDFIIIKCNLRCRDQAHFHCCYCMTTVIRKDQIIKHLRACGRQSPTPSPEPLTESTLGTKPESVRNPMSSTEPASISEPASTPEPASIIESAFVAKPGFVCKSVSITKPASLAKHAHVHKKVQCTHCGITLNKKNLDMHIRRKHRLKMHVTILKRGQEAPIERCTTCCNNLKYHCPFCTSEVYHPNELYHVKNHVFNHLSLAVKHEDFIIVKCNLSCRDQAHFHCCYCTTTVIRKVQIIKHLTVCKRRSNRPSPTPPPCTPKTFTFVTVPVSAAELMYVTVPASFTEPASATKSALLAKRVRVQEKVQCTHCGITVNKKNLNMHIRRKHSLKAQVRRQLSSSQVPLK